MKSNPVKRILVLAANPKETEQLRLGEEVREIDKAQRLNENSEIIIFGITSNGDFWQFGKLEGHTFTRNKTFYTIQDLDQLFAAVNYIFQQCEASIQKDL